MRCGPQWHKGHQVCTLEIQPFLSSGARRLYGVEVRDQGLTKYCFIDAMNSPPPPPYSPRRPGQQDMLTESPHLTVSPDAMSSGAMPSQYTASVSMATARS